MAQYMMLVYEEEVDPAVQAEREKVTPMLVELHASLREAGLLVGVQRLYSTESATSVRVRDGGRHRVGRLSARPAHARLLTSSSDKSTPARRAVSNHSSGGMTGRTSIVAQGAMGSRAATLIASSRSAHSST